MKTYIFENLLHSGIRIYIQADSHYNAQELLEYTVSEPSDYKLIS